MVYRGEQQQQQHIHMLYQRVYRCKYCARCKSKCLPICTYVVIKYIPIPVNHSRVVKCVWSQAVLTSWRQLDVRVKQNKGDLI